MQPQQYDDEQNKIWNTAQEILDQGDSDYDDLLSENKELKDRLQHGYSAYNELKDRLQHGYSAYNELAPAYNELNNKLEDMTKQFAEGYSEHEKMSNTYEEMKEKFEEANSKYYELKALLPTLRNRVASRTKRIEQLTSENNTLESKNNTLESRNNTLESENSNLQKNITGITTDNYEESNAYYEDFADYQQQINRELSNLKKTILSELTQAQQDTAMCDRKYQELVKNMGGTGDKIISDKIATYNLMAKNYEERIAGYKEQLKDAATERETLHRRLKGEIEMLIQHQEGFTNGDGEEERKALTATLNKLMSQNNSSKEVIKELEITNAQYEAQLSKHKTQIEKLMSERASMKKQIDMMAKQAASDADTIAAEKADKNAVLDHLEATINDYGELEAARKTIAEQEAMLKELERQYEENEAKLNDYEHEAREARYRSEKEAMRVEQLRQDAEDEAMRSEKYRQNVSNLQKERDQDYQDYQDMTKAIAERKDIFFDTIEEQGSNPLTGIDIRPPS